MINSEYILMAAACALVLIAVIVVILIVCIKHKRQKRNNEQQDLPEFSAKDRAAIELIAALAEVLNELKH